MPSRTLRFAGALLLIAACQPSPADYEEVTARVRDEVRAVAEDLLAAKNVPDGAAVVEFYSDAPTFSYLGCTDFTIGGESFNQLFPQVYDRREAGSYQMRIGDLKVLGPDAAVVSLVGSAGPQPHLFATQVWSREDGDWQVILEHASWPDCEAPRGPHPYTSPPASGDPASTGR